MKNMVKRMTVMYEQELLTPVNEPTNVQVFKILWSMTTTN